MRSHKNGIPKKSKLYIVTSKYIKPSKKLNGLHISVAQTSLLPLLQPTVYERGPVYGFGQSAHWSWMCCCGGQRWTQVKQVCSQFLKARYCPTHDWTGQGRPELPINDKYCRLGRCVQVGGIECWSEWVYLKWTTKEMLYSNWTKVTNLNWN